MIAILIFIALLYQIFFFGFTGFLQGIFGLCLGIALLFIPFALGGMGGGDVKMMGAVGAFLGPNVFVSFLYTAILGGIWALIVMTVTNRSHLSRFAANVKSIFLFSYRSQTLRPHQSKHSPRFSYGGVIALGAMLYCILDLFENQLISF